jgi:hypothetical protein
MENVMKARAITFSVAVALGVAMASAGAVQAGGPVRSGDAYTDTFHDEFILELCGIDTMTTVTERWTLKEFADGSAILHVVRTFVPNDVRIPIEKGAGTSFFAPDGTQTVVGAPLRLLDRRGGIRLIGSGLVEFDPNGDIVRSHGHDEALGIDLAPYYCP